MSNTTAPMDVRNLGAPSKSGMTFPDNQTFCQEKCKEDDSTCMTTCCVKSCEPFDMNCVKDCNIYINNK